MLERRRADAVELGRRQRRASRRARTQLAPATGTGPVEDTTVVTAEGERTDRQQRQRARRRGDEGPDYAALARLARTGLLDLKSDFAYWNPELADPAGVPDPVTPEPVELDPAEQVERRAGGEQGAEG